MNNVIKYIKVMTNKNQIASEVKYNSSTSTLAHETRKNAHWFSILVIAALAVTAAFTSCDEKSEKEDPNQIKLLKIITECFRNYDNLDYNSGCYDKYKFEYDEQNRITKMSEYYFDGSLYYTKTFTYAGDDLVKVLHSSSSGHVSTYEYTKSGNTITEKDTYDGGVKISIIELNIDGIPVKRTREDEYGNTYVETYGYQDGNLTGYTMTATSQSGYTDVDSETYQYDNQKGALYHCKTPKWYLILELNYFGVKNNRTEEGWIRHSAKYTYEFDGVGFPAKRTCKSTNGMSAWVSVWLEEFNYITK